MKKSIYIYGASGHGIVIADIARNCGYNDIIFIDDGKNEYKSFENIKHNCTIPFAFGIGSNKIRKILFDKVNNSSLNIVSLIHPSAIISPSVTIGKGTVVMSNVVINAKSKIGNGVILNTGCIIEHENTIENFVHISPNVALAGDVKVGEMTHIGIGSCVTQGIQIKEFCIIGAGSVVVKNIGQNKLAFGNPCKEIKELN